MDIERFKRLSIPKIEAGKMRNSKFGELIGFTEKIVKKTE